MTKSLLPVGSQPLLRTTSQAMSQATELPVPLRELWHPDSCPLPLLPYLAWSLSVDSWDQTWPEVTKRQAIKDAWYVHRHKGTIGAIERVVSQLGYVANVLEWWQTTPPARRGTLHMQIGVISKGIGSDDYQELERVVDDAKPLSRHISGWDICLGIRNGIAARLASYQGETITVYPYQTLQISGSVLTGMPGATHIIETITIGA